MADPVTHCIHSSSKRFKSYGGLHAATLSTSHLPDKARMRYHDMLYWFGTLREAVECENRFELYSRTEMPIDSRGADSWSRQVTSETLPTNVTVEIAVRDKQYWAYNDLLAVSRDSLSY